MNPAIRGLLDKAQQSTEAAQSLLADNYVDFSASRAYYAMFYALEALLLTKNLSFSKHSAVIAAFGKEYIKSGILDARFHRAVIDAFDLRNAGDYGTMHAVSAELASQTIQNAKELIHAVSSHIEGLQRPKGFTLVELAVSLVVIGLLIGLGVGMVGPLMTAIKVRESKENLGGAVESINSWAAGNNHLPDMTNSNFKTVVKTPADSWGRDFIYLYDCLLASTNPSSPLTTDTIQCSGASPSFSKDTICGRRTTRINLVTDQGSTVNNVAYVMFSLSEDASVDTRMTGTLNNPALTVGPSNPAILNNTLIPNSGFVTPTAPATTATITLNANNNDLVRWVTLDELRTKVGCQGAQLRIVNNELPFGYATSPYASTVTADGGVPYSSGGKYRWCIEGVAPAGNTLLFRSTANTAIPFSANCKTALQESSWIQSDALVISLATFAGNTDSTNIYACTLSHTAATDNRPTSGTNWSQYWKLIGTTATVTPTATWTSGTSYAPPPSTNSFTIYVRDNGDTTVATLPNVDNDNIASKTFVLTINP